MAFIEAKCKNCGAKITLNEKMTRGICEFCGTEFIKSDLIVNNNYSFENATVVVDNSSLIQQQLINADTFLTKLKDYDKAMESFLSVTKTKADDHRGWWGVVRTISREFTYMELTADEYAECRKYAENALSLAPEDEKTEYEKLWENYSSKISQRLLKEIEEENEIKLRLKNAEERGKRIRRARRTAADIISVVINVVLLIYVFTHDLSTVTSDQIVSLIYIGIALVGNSLLAVLFEFVGSSPECFIFQALSTTGVLGNLFYHLLFDEQLQTVELIIAGIVLLFIAFIVFIICEFLPYQVFKRFTDK